MKLPQLTRLILAVGIINLAPLCPAASVFTGIHVFGDSLSDTGNLSLFSWGLQPGADYYQGRYSNGPVWVEQLATDYLGLPAPTPSLAGGSNNAWAGAATSGGAVPSILGQVDGFVGAGGSFSSTDLVVLWAGANDFLREGVTNPGIPVANISTSIQALAGAGATTILIPNLPDLSNTPAITSLGDPTTSGGMQALTLGFNGLLEGELASLRASLGIDLVRLDVFTLANEVTANPAAFGFANATEGAYLVGEIANANDYTYWDGIHPTESMHRLFAQRGARALGVPEPSTAVFAALGALGIALRRRR